MKRTPVKFTFYMDPGHGWIKVQRSFLKELGVHDKISSYSYERGDFVYLEEDCDASIFLEAYIKSFEKKPELDYRHTNKSSKIRSYDCYEKGEQNA